MVSVQPIYQKSRVDSQGLHSLGWWVVTGYKSSSMSMCLALQLHVAGVFIVCQKQISWDDNSVEKFMTQLKDTGDGDEAGAPPTLKTRVCTDYSFELMIALNKKSQAIIEVIIIHLEG